MGANNSSLEYTSIDTYIIREYIGKPLMLTKNDRLCDQIYKKEMIKKKLTEFFRWSMFWEVYFRDRVGVEMEYSDWKIYVLRIFKRRPLIELIKRVRYTDRRHRDIVRVII